MVGLDLNDKGVEGKKECESDLDLVAGSGRHRQGQRKSQDPNQGCKTQWIERWQLDLQSQ